MQSEEDNFISIPDLSTDPQSPLGMQYFIPEWDDRVDPGYNFLKNEFTSNRDTYTDDVYAHEMYSTANYDGILVSKVVVDKNKTKRAYIEGIGGIHNFIRFSGKPVMGDCGAFGYINEPEPPYKTEDILEYYERLGFNYGVSIDHLIVGIFAEPEHRDRRYELTIKNAEDFIQKHHARGYSFIPIGVAQGWSPETYADAVKALIDMGYDYVALGGLARAPSQQIIKVIKAVYPNLKPNTQMHIFGVGRINLIEDFRHLGVTSFDSASPLRSAWLDSKANYHILSGETYAAVRIPPVDKHGVRIKRVLEAGISNPKELKRLEQESLQAMREFDADKLTVEETLSVLLAYDKFLELPVNGEVKPEAQDRRLRQHAQMYRKLLEDKPWRFCDCPICEELKVEVVIFRGNDRNRRRGFHNTYVFYKRFKEILKSKI